DEGEILLGLTNPEEIAEKFMDMGCSTVAVKLGKEGCYVTDKAEKLYVNPYRLENPQDTVGAGDGFAAGFLSGMLCKVGLRECAEHANGVGAMAVLVKGDMEGYPNVQQLLAFIGKTKTIER
ncbi:MAG: PfkB family carbohydrate kinase, partial [Clostridiaceae bacterium]|nr:PfkB family carbohydrate kinase [Clostridiaceae bacterium]